MLIPSEFARLAVVHGTTTTISDPHEIANVLGLEGIRYMINNGKKVPFKFNFGASCCVPATGFESSGAVLNADDIKQIMIEADLKYMSEMMNFPGVIFNDADVLGKIAVAKELGKPIDGHAPGLKGEQLKAYVNAGISTDHEAYEIEEAEEKIALGMKILIREGSAAKNYEVLKPLIKKHPDMVMLCSDDKHPDDLIAGHINELIARAIKDGYDLFDIMKAAIINPVEHYKLDSGMLRIGDDADIIVVNNFSDFRVLQTYIKGILVAENGVSLIERVDEELVNNFNVEKKSLADFIIKPDANSIRVIEALDGQLVTNSLLSKPEVVDGNIVSDLKNDILKMAVVNRYKNTPPAIGFIRNFGLKKGAIASSVAHDSHNIIAIGTTDEELCKAVNTIIECRGGICAVDNRKKDVLPLPVAGIMTNEDGKIVAQKYSEIDRKVKDFGSKLNAPFMTLSFMALLVIPSIKLSDKGLFDGNKFEFTELEVNS